MSLKTASLKAVWLKDNVMLSKANILIALMFLLVCLAWGTTWIAIKFSVDSIPPMMSSALRFLVAFPAFLLLAKITGSRILPRREEVPFYLIATIFYFSVPYALMNYAEQYLSSGLAALIFSSMPVLILVFSHFMLQSKINRFQILGIVIGLVGFFLIIQAQHQDLNLEHGLGIVALFLAAVMHAGYYVYVKKAGAKISSIAMNTLPLGAAGLALFVRSIIVEPIHVADFSFKSIIAVLYLGLFASVVGFLAYFELLKRVSPVVVSFVFLIFPIFALLISALFETSVNLNAEFVLYCLVIMFGFALTKVENLKWLGTRATVNPTAEQKNI